MGAGSLSVLLGSCWFKELLSSSSAHGRMTCFVWEMFLLRVANCAPMLAKINEHPGLLLSCSQVSWALRVLLSDFLMHLCGCWWCLFPCSRAGSSSFHLCKINGCILLGTSPLLELRMNRAVCTELRGNRACLCLAVSIAALKPFLQCSERQRNQQLL